jgi:hypothetical protein
LSLEDAIIIAKSKNACADDMLLEDDIPDDFLIKIPLFMRSYNMQTTYNGLLRRIRIPYKPMQQGNKLPRKLEVSSEYLKN